MSYIRREDYPEEKTGRQALLQGAWFPKEDPSVNSLRSETRSEGTVAPLCMNMIQDVPAGNRGHGRGMSQEDFLFLSSVAVDSPRNVTHCRVNHAHKDRAPAECWLPGDMWGHRATRADGGYCSRAVSLARPLPPAELGLSAFTLGPWQLPSTH